MLRDRGYIVAGALALLVLLFRPAPVLSAADMTPLTGVSALGALGGYCRIMELGYVPFDVYIDHAFTRCFTHLVWNESNALFAAWWRSNCSRTFGFSDDAAFAHALSYIDNVTDASRWRSCCEAAVQCCERIAVPAIVEDDSQRCPPTWDGLQCWDSALANTAVKGECPHFYYTHCPYYGYSYSVKRCLDDGTWYKHPDECRGYEKEWTNYTQCSTQNLTLALRRTRIWVRDSMFGVTVVTAIPAVIIFLAYRQLRVQKNVIHVNFLISIVMSSTLFIVYDAIVSLKVIDQGAMFDQQSTSCILLTVFVHKYVRLTNYTWMLCEGFFLHKLIAAAFARQDSMVVFYIVGWLVPVFPVAVYCVIRARHQHLNTACWIEMAEPYEWIINSIIIGAFVINFLFLINIVRILLTTFKKNTAIAVHQYRKTVRAVVALTPLLGVTFFFTFYRPQCHAAGFHQYQIFNSILEGLQGFFVALIFCYLNGEVIACVELTLKKRFPVVSPQALCHCSTRHSDVSLTDKAEQRVLNPSAKNAATPQCDIGLTAITDQENSNLSVSCSYDVSQPVTIPEKECLTNTNGAA